MKPTQSMLEQWYGKDRAKRIRRERGQGPRQVAKARAQAAKAVDGQFAGTAYMQNGSVALGDAVASESVVTPEGKKIPSPEQRADLKAAMDKAVTSVMYAANRAKLLAMATPSTGVAAVLSTIFPMFAPTLLGASAPSAVKSAVVSAIDSLNGVIDQRLIATKQQVLDGDLDPSRWFNNVETIKSGIESILRELNDSGTIAAFDKGVTDAREEFNVVWGSVKRLAGEAAVKAQTALKVGLAIQVGVGLLALFLAWPILKNVATAYLTAPLKASGLGRLPTGSPTRKRAKR